MKKIILKLIVLVSCSSVSWADTMPEKIVVMGQELTLKEQKGDVKRGFIAEYIPQAATWDNWRLLFAIRFMPGTNIDPASLAQAFIEDVAKKKREGDPVANGQVLSNPKKGLFAVDFIISSLGTSSKEVFFEHNVFVFFKVPKGIISYQIARRSYAKVDSKQAIAKFILEIPTLVDPMITELSTQPVKPPFKVD